MPGTRCTLAGRLMAPGPGAQQWLICRCTFVGGYPPPPCPSAATGTWCTLVGSPVARGSGRICTCVGGVLSLAASPTGGGGKNEGVSFSCRSAAAGTRCTLAGRPVARGSEPIRGWFDGVLSLADLTQVGAGDQWLGPHRSLNSARHAVYFSRQARRAGLGAHRWLV